MSVVWVTVGRNHAPVQFNHKNPQLCCWDASDVSSQEGATARISEGHYARNTGPSNTSMYAVAEIGASSPERSPQLMTEPKQVVSTGYSRLNTNRRPFRIQCGTARSKRRSATWNETVAIARAVAAIRQHL